VQIISIMKIGLVRLGFWMKWICTKMQYLWANCPVTTLITTHPPGGLSSLTTFGTGVLYSTSCHPWQHLRQACCTVPVQHQYCTVPVDAFRYCTVTKVDINWIINPIWIICMKIGYFCIYIYVTCSQNKDYYHWLMVHICGSFCK